MVGCGGKPASVSKKKTENAMKTLTRDYSVGNTKHEIYEHTDKEKRDAWTVIVGEDQPRVYRRLLEEWVESNLVGRAMTVDLSDAKGIIDLLTVGRARLGDPDKFVDVD